MNFVAIPSIATCFVAILGIATAVNPSKYDINTPVGAMRCTFVGICNLYKLDTTVRFVPGISVGCPEYAAYRIFIRKSN